MIYLPDVNTLIALGFIHHEFHHRVGAWIRAEEYPVLATCSITELGFVRVLGQVPGYDHTVTRAAALLLQLKATGVISTTFIADNHDVSHLPSWVKTPKQTTDGHLAELAHANGAILATLDAKIPGAYLIPNS
jgi:predicted nucleic acid-binding protein